jgi:Tol biopolymer transport system component
VAYQARVPGKRTQIFVLEPDGAQRQLTDLGGGAYEPTWSPDGSQIAFAGHLGNHDDTDIFVMNSDGSDLRRFVGTGQEDRRPDWSPDGSQILFDTYIWLWVASVPDGEPKRLGRGAITLYHTPAAEATWSPDGRWILLTRYALGTINNRVPSAVPWVMRSDGSGEHPLYPSRQPYGVCRVGSTWSPDGRSIAFIDGSPSDGIGIIDLRNGDIGYVSTPGHVADLDWSTAGILVSAGDDSLATRWDYAHACP